LRDDLTAPSLVLAGIGVACLAGFACRRAISFLFVRTLYDV
jgi:hypothetical protein